jgi:hypothetical protein
MPDHLGGDLHPIYVQKGTPHMRNPYHLLVATAVLLAALLTGACTAITPTSAPAASMPEIIIKASDFTFDMPDKIEAGLVALTLENDGKEPHHAQLARLNDDVTMEQFTAALRQQPEAALPLVTLAGGVGIAAPGKSERVMLELKEGRYVVLCFVSGEDNIPHLAKGMIKPFEVIASTDKVMVREPKADYTVVMKDFAFVMPPEIKAGSQVWKVTNEGPQPHELAIVKLARGKTMADIQAYMQKPEGLPPFKDAGGLQAIATGMSGWINVNLQPGDYLALCFVPDPVSGRAHIELGMITPFTVR